MTFRSLFENYQRDPKTSFNTSLKVGTVRVYTTYLKKLIPHIGARRIDRCDGRDVMGWFSSGASPAMDLDEISYRSRASVSPSSRPRSRSASSAGRRAAASFRRSWAS